MAKRGRPPKKKTEEVAKVEESKVEETKEEVEVQDEKEETKEDKRPNLNVSPPVSQSKQQRDLNEMIPVKNISNSSLIYISKNNPGYRVDWDGFGEEVYMEYKELINMRGSQRRFFEEPWIVCDWDVLEDLRVDKYYENLIDLDDINTIFDLTTDKLAEKLRKLPTGIRRLIADRAYELVRNGELDSMSKIRKIEQILDIELGTS